MTVSPISNSIGSLTEYGSRFSFCGTTPADRIILQNSRALPSPMGGSFASNSMIALSMP